MKNAAIKVGSLVSIVCIDGKRRTWTITEVDSKRGFATAQKGKGYINQAISDYQMV